MSLRRAWKTGNMARSSRGAANWNSPTVSASRSEVNLATIGVLMIGTATPLEPGLYLVATPIGAARDITLRALDVLAAADVLVAEDTRTLRHLMDIHGIALQGRPVLAYHDHNGDRVRPKILAHVAAGRSVAYASDAGTPLIADPGYRLARAVAEAGHRVTTAPGATAAIAALTLSGL